MSKSTFLMVRSKGSALIIALVFLLVMTLLGTTAMQGTSQQENMAGNMRDRSLAFQAAEAALRAGERWLLVQEASSQVSQTPIPPFTGTATGLLLAQGDALWTAYDWDNQSLYTTNTTTPPTGALELSQLNQQPSYFIEDRTEDVNPSNPDVRCAGGSAAVVPPFRCYRVTARGVGGSPNAIVVLQSTVYLRNPP